SRCRHHAGQVEVDAAQKLGVGRRRRGEFLELRLGGDQLVAPLVRRHVGGRGRREAAKQAGGKEKSQHRSLILSGRGRQATAGGKAVGRQRGRQGIANAYDTRNWPKAASGLLGHSGIEFGR